ncbi:MAG: hypothetical protein M3071_23865, partial [Actinomycetota bacterium]|nr:hypothetical protein [Actinomycetota bacterium]
RTVLLTGDALTQNEVRETVQELGDQARRALGEPEAELSAVFELRYQGQAFELAIAAGVAPSPDELREAFEAEHEDRYGYRDPAQVLELVTVRVAATLAGAEPSLSAGDTTDDSADKNTDDTANEPPTRPATLHGERLDLQLLTAPAPGTPITGPAVVVLPEATLLVPPEWSGEVDGTGTIRIER